MLLSCEVSSANVPVTWRKDNIVVEEGGRYIVKKKGPTHTLEIKKLQLEDAGEYCCITRGKKTTGKLIVKGMCIPQWTFIHYSLIYWNILLKLEETGYSYSVTVNTLFHSLKSQLYLAPSSSTERVRVVTELQDVTVTAGEDAVFVCELSHADVSEGVWWLGSSPLQKNEMNQMTYHGRQHRLVLTMTTPEETGTVAFVVGEEKTSASLLVVPKPKGVQRNKAYGVYISFNNLLTFFVLRQSNSNLMSFLVLFEEKPKDTVVLEGETATLSCTTSDFTTQVTWRRNHIPLQHGEKYEMHKKGKVNLLYIHDVDPLDTGIYSCDTGDAQSTAKLTVTGN